MTVTYHKNAHAGQNTHYRVLTYLQNGGAPNIPAIAQGLGIHRATVRVAIQRLQLEGMIVTGQILQDFVITLTDDGAQWKAPKEVRPEELQPCGHPKSRILPNGQCHDCRDIERRETIKHHPANFQLLRTQMR